MGVLDSKVDNFYGCLTINIPAGKAIHVHYIIYYTTILYIVNNPIVYYVIVYYIIEWGKGFAESVEVNLRYEIGRFGLSVRIGGRRTNFV